MVIYIDEGKSDLFFSPLSIYSALSLVFAGSAGISREEFMATFHLTEQEGLCKALGEGIRGIFEQDVGKTMVQANGAFIDARLQLLNQFKKGLKVHFDAEFQETDFTRATAAAQLINAWIEQHTQQKIKNLINPSSIDASVDMMLVNAIYFKGINLLALTASFAKYRFVEK